jgi:hypothetical protein
MLTMCLKDIGALQQRCCAKNEFIWGEKINFVHLLLVYKQVWCFFFFICVLFVPSNYTLNLQPTYVIFKRSLKYKLNTCFKSGLYHVFTNRWNVMLWKSNLIWILVHYVNYCVYKSFETWQVAGSYFDMIIKG